VDELSNAQRKVLRQCAVRVYEAEATLMLEELEADFKRWRENELQIDSLFESIHKFHQVKAKSLWSTYQTLKPSETVARGLAFQIIPESDVPEDIREHLAPLIDFFAGSQE
jgi:hypothetical protein